jgi:hypothetical protein
MILSAGGMENEGVSRDASHISSTKINVSRTGGILSSNTDICLILFHFQFLVLLQ